MFIPEKLKPWFDARKRFRLSHAQVQMARELGLNPKSLGKLDNHKQQPWKVPLPEFIEHLYFKRFGLDRPDSVRSLEDVLAAEESKKSRKREQKVARLQTGVETQSVAGEEAKLSAEEIDDAIPIGPDLSPRSRRKGESDSEKRWANIQNLIEYGGTISIGGSPFDGPSRLSADDGGQCLVMLELRSGDTLVRTLDRLDAAIAAAEEREWEFIEFEPDEIPDEYR